ncbi:MAG: hypothetical protein ABWZ79_02440 [Pedobacter agri]
MKSIALIKLFLWKGNDEAIYYYSFAKSIFVAVEFKWQITPQWLNKTLNCRANLIDETEGFSLSDQPKTVRLTGIKQT